MGRAQGVFINMLSKFDDSGIKNAQKGFGGIKKTLAGIGAGIALKQIGDLLLDSAKAASADAKSIKLMNMQLTKNAGATKDSLKQNDKFIQSLSLQTGILDDDLRPSLSKFGNVTHNVGKAQKLLKLQLDVVAGSQKSGTKVANALAKAYAGNTKSLIGMFPELKNSKDALGDLTKEFAGDALANADPFMRFNNSIDILKESLGAIILPMIAGFVDYISKSGGLIDTVQKFFKEVNDPNTKTGKAFKELKQTVMKVFKAVKGFFDFIGGGNTAQGIIAVAEAVLGVVLAMKAFAFISTAVEIALGIINGELIVLDGALTATGWTLVVAAIVAVIAGITWLATQTSFFQDTWTVMVAIFQDGISKIVWAWDMVKTGFSIAFEFIGKMFKGYVNFWIGLFESFVNGISNGINGMLGGLNMVLDGVKTASFGSIDLHVNNIPMVKLPRLAKGGIVMPRPGGTNVTVGEAGSAEAIVPLNGRNGFGTTVNIYVTAADPKAVVDAVSKYVKGNGKLPSAWGR